MRYFLFLLLIVVFPVTAEAFDFGSGSIDIPRGFEGPATKALGRGGNSVAFSKFHNDGGATLLQITTWDSGQTFPEMSEQELKEGAEQYLLQFLGGIARKRSNFQRGEVEFIRISGQPAARVDWQGQASGKEAHGVMYCLIHDSKILSFHTQDLASFHGRYTRMATSAFESVRLN